MKVQGRQNDPVNEDRLKRPISPFLEVRFEAFIDSYM